MKAFIRLVTVLVTVIVSLHYYCEIKGCSDNLKQVCHYTSPTVWDTVLSGNNEVYRDNVSPYVNLASENYNKLVKPQVISFIEDVEVYSRPLCAKACATLKEFEVEKKLVAGLNASSQFYYAQVLPTVRHLSKQLRLDEACEAVHAKIDPILVKYNVYDHLECARPYVDLAKEYTNQFVSFLKVKYSAFSVEDVKKAVEQPIVKRQETSTTQTTESTTEASSTVETSVETTATETESTVESSKSSESSEPSETSDSSEPSETSESSEPSESSVSSESSSKVESATENIEDEEPTSTITSTSTYLTTVTRSDLPTNKIGEDFEFAFHYNSLESIPDRAESLKPAADAAFEEYAHSLNKMVDAKVNTTKESILFENERNSFNIIKALIPEIDTIVKNYTQVNEHWSGLVNEFLARINSNPMIDEEKKMILYIKENSEVIDQFPTRKEARKVLTGAHDVAKSIVNEMKNAFKVRSDEITERRKEVNARYLEMYTKWTENVINALNQKFIDTYGEFDRENATEEQLEAEKLYRKTKKRTNFKVTSVEKYSDISGTIFRQYQDFLNKQVDKVSGLSDLVIQAKNNVKIRFLKVEREVERLSHKLNEE